LRSDLRESEIAEIAKHPLFAKYGWPGNIRELKNIVERFAVLFSGNFDEVSYLLKNLFPDFIS
jgi:propionate catabolism operon transcriptional regulator